MHAAASMKLFPVLMFLAILCTSLVVHAAPGAGQDNKVAPRFTVNLDLPPQQRWSEVVSAYQEDLERVLKLVEKYVPEAVLYALAPVGLEVEKTLPYPYNYEIMGIADLLPGMTVGDVILGNLIYEVTAFNHGKQAKACTSIVAQASNGSIYHGRNLDYNLFDFLHNMTITVDFQRGNKTVYTGSTFAGYVGLLTGQKPHGYTISLDERDRGEVWMNILEALVNGVNVAAFHIRDTLENEGFDYEEAVVFLADKPLIAPCYIIIGGTRPGQGAVITRDRIAVLDLWKLDVAGGRWYVLETNYDHWEAPPPDDNRRDPAIKYMNETGSAYAGVAGLFAVLSTPPVLNENTAFTVVMSAAHPELYTTWIRN